MVFDRTQLFSCLIFLAVVITAKSQNGGDGLTRTCNPDATTIHEFTLRTIENDADVSLSQYSGKILLVVNVASFCQFTVQYLAMNELKSLPNLQNKFEIVAIPCNQFAFQEPGKDKYELLNSLKYCRPGYGFEPNFDLYFKIDVNGENEIPLYTHLKHGCPAVKDDIGDPTLRFWTPFRNNDITWNFNKFLIGPDGIPLRRYDSAVEPMDILDDIRDVMRDYKMDMSESRREVEMLKEYVEKKFFNS